MALTATQMAIMSIVSAAASAAGSIQQGRAASAASKTQAELYRRQAQREQQIGALNASRARKDAEALAGKQRAFLAGSGADPSSGSALLVQEDLAEEGEFNARLAENNALHAAQSRMSAAVLARAAGRGAQQGSYFRAGSTLLGAAAKSGGMDFSGGKKSASYAGPQPGYGGWS